MIINRFPKKSGPIIFGIVINKTNGSVTRLTPGTDPYHYVNITVLTEPKDTISSQASFFDNYYPWNQLTKRYIHSITKDSSSQYTYNSTTGPSTELDNFTPIPLFFYKITHSDNNCYIYIKGSTGSTDDGIKPDSGWSSTSYERYISTYACYSDGTSKSHAAIIVNKNYTTMLGYANKRTTTTGQTVGLVTSDTIMAVLLLYLIEFASIDIFANLGDSYSSYTSGATDSLNYHTGSITSSGRTILRYRNIEGFFDRLAFHIGGWMQVGATMYYQTTTLNSQSLSTLKSNGSTATLSTGTNDTYALSTAGLSAKPALINVNFFLPDFTTSSITWGDSNSSFERAQSGNSNTQFVFTYGNIYSFETIFKTGRIVAVTSTPEIHCSLRTELHPDNRS